MATDQRRCSNRACPAEKRDLLDNDGPESCPIPQDLLRHLVGDAEVVLLCVLGGVGSGINCCCHEMYLFTLD